MEMLDFMLGWATIDVAGDDGTKLSAWPWRRGGLLTRRQPDPKEPYTICQKCKRYRSMPQGVNGPGGWSPFDKITGAGKARPEPRLCRCASARREPETPTRVASRPGAAPAQD